MSVSVFPLLHREMHFSPVQLGWWGRRLCGCTPSSVPLPAGWGLSCSQNGCVLGPSFLVGCDGGHGVHQQLCAAGILPLAWRTGRSLLLSRRDVASQKPRRAPDPVGAHAFRGARSLPVFPRNRRHRSANVCTDLNCPKLDAHVAKAVALTPTLTQISTAHRQQKQRRCTLPRNKPTN
jgi:2-polyprenyl-6-methoxyphenol hydroxylase-like FAD-dependent oxidoreductase